MTDKAVRLVTQSPTVVHVAQEELLLQVGELLTAPQKKTLLDRYGARSGMVLKADWERKSGDLVVEWLPRWQAIDKRLWERNGYSYHLRIHPDGTWHLAEQGGHLPKKCNRCRNLPDMQGPVGEYPVVVARAELAGKGLDEYWKARLQQTDSSTRRIMDVPVGQGSPEGYEYWSRSERRFAMQREKDLVADFCTYLTREDRKFTSKTIKLASSSIRCDVFDETNGVLFEAKADSSDRAQLRMAIGQLLDYGYFGFESKNLAVRKALLLPEMPSAEILELLAHLGLGVAWRVSPAEYEEQHPREAAAR